MRVDARENSGGLFAVPAISRPAVRGAAVRAVLHACVAALLCAAGLPVLVPQAAAAPPKTASPKATRTAGGEAAEEALQAAFEARVDAALREHGLGPERVALLVYSTGEGRYLYRRNIHSALIAASNAKLVTTFSALRVLSPDYRWRTRFFLVTEHDGAGGPPRQGLLVQGTGDPTLSGADLERVAWILRSRGIERLEAGIWFDGSRFDDVAFPASWGDVSRAEPWFAPVSPFIVDKNIIEFLIATRPEGMGFEVFTATPGFQVLSALEPSALERPAIRVSQHWGDDTATFTVQGTLAPAEEPYEFAAAVEKPRVHFYRHLRAALEQAGVQGALPLRRDPPPPRRRHVHTQLSPPLREVLMEVNKHSSNLAAEVLLRTMGLQESEERVSTEDGLKVLRRVMAREFPEAPRELHQVDGSGLSRENRVSPLLLVRLLNRVRQDFALRPEFINSLSVALTDGTLQYRNFPWRMRGRLRAKTGTLAGVSNLSGYLQLRRDVIVFSFLVNDPNRHFLELQDAQDGAATDLYDALLAREAGDREALRPPPQPRPPGVEGPMGPLPPRGTVPWKADPPRRHRIRPESPNGAAPGSPPTAGPIR